MRVGFVVSWCCFLVCLGVVGWCFLMFYCVLVGRLWVVGWFAL